MILKKAETFHEPSACWFLVPSVGLWAYHSCRRLRPRKTHARSQTPARGSRNHPHRGRRDRLRGIHRPHRRDENRGGPRPSNRIPPENPLRGCAEVEAGTPLFEIDRRPYKATLDRAEGTLAQALAREKRAEANYRRRTSLYLGDTVSQEELDLAVDEFAEARAIQIAKADRDLAALNLDFTEVKAEISGRLSRRLVDVGNLIQADQTPLTTIVAIDKLYIYFEIDERTLLKLRRFVQEGRIQSRAQGAEIPIEAALADSPEFHIKGKIDFSDNRVDVNTGTLRPRRDRQPQAASVLPRPLPPRSPTHRPAPQRPPYPRTGTPGRPGSKICLCNK